LSWLARIADYERPWVGRVGLALIVALWLLLTLVGFAAGVGTGLSFLVAGAALIAGEVFIERSGRNHSAFALFWHLSWRIGIAVVLIVLGAVGDGSLAVASILAVWLTLTGLLPALYWWHERRAAADE
jgi:hypothetical protein